MLTQKSTGRIQWIVVAVMFLAVSQLFAAIPETERAALIALYNSTDGDNWTDNSGWKTPPLHTDGFTIPGTEGGWNGVTVSGDHIIQLLLHDNNLSGSIPVELGNLSSLNYVDLTSNQLSGNIPAELGGLSGLGSLRLDSNQLSGSIPAGLGNLNNLSRLFLRYNQLSGSIPAELGNLNNLTQLWLTSNQLSGSIPAELGNLNNLARLWLNGNQLSGSIPAELANLTDLSSTNIGYNALYTDDAALKAFLNSKDWDWESTQTVVPADITTTPTDSSGITVSWTPIPFTDYTGGYHILYSKTSGGPYFFGPITPDKSADSVLVSGLTAGETYYFVVSTRTDPHVQNGNTVYSEPAAEVEGKIELIPEEPAGKAKLMAMPLVGVPGTTVQFVNNYGGRVNRFIYDFGDGHVEGYRHGTMPKEKVHPPHTYTEIGVYTVSITAKGWEGNPPDTQTMPNLICISADYIPLAVLSGSETHEGCGWDKTIDQDVFGGNCKMTADLPDVECVYSFTDSSVRNVNRVRLFIDDVNKDNYPGHLTRKFEVWVSVDYVSWTQALATTIPWQYRSQFSDFSFEPVLGRYIKLKLIEPHNIGADIIQLTEFQAFGALGEDAPLEKGLLADNSPVTECKLAQNYPNPFNPTTTISFALPEAANVSLQVYNVTGRMVAELVNGRQKAGRHQVVFDAAHLTSGVYFSVMRVAGVEQVNRMILMK
ncbi:T9SS type A sorting domain-containing protein [bacterium]|nr:T9SS type A sorting domain-containing protein [bacterium]